MGSVAFLQLLCFSVYTCMLLSPSNLFDPGCIFGDASASCLFLLDSCSTSFHFPPFLVPCSYLSDCCGLGMGQWGTGRGPRLLPHLTLEPLPLPPPWSPMGNLFIFAPSPLQMGNRDSEKSDDKRAIEKSKKKKRATTTERERENMVCGCGIRWEESFTSYNIY